MHVMGMELKLLKIHVWTGYLHCSVNWQKHVTYPTLIFTVIYRLGILYRKVMVLSLIYAQQHQEILIEPQLFLSCAPSRV